MPRPAGAFSRADGDNGVLRLAFARAARYARNSHVRFRMFAIHTGARSAACVSETSPTSRTQRHPMANNTPVPIIASFGAIRCGQPLGLRLRCNRCSAYLFTFLCLGGRLKIRKSFSFTYTDTCGASGRAGQTGKSTGRSTSAVRTDGGA